jgi:uncharacterized protein YdiU (UPF0061 family)
LAQRFGAKLGLPDGAEAPSELVETILQLLASESVDFTIFWRRLSHWAATQAPVDSSVQDLFLNRDGINAWLDSFANLHTPPNRLAASLRMLQVNPKFVLRNHLGELAIRAARHKDFSLVANLLKVLLAPYDEHPEHAVFADFPPDWAPSIEISCSS